MGNGLDAKDTFAFAIDLQGQLAAVQLEDRQILGRSLHAPFPRGRSLGSAISRAATVSQDRPDGLQVQGCAAAVDQGLKHLVEMPAHLEHQVATVFDSWNIDGRTCCAFARRREVRSTDSCRSNARRPGSIAL